MTRKVSFIEEILNELKEIKDNKEGVVLFGAADIGRIAKKAIDDMNIEVKCYCDNDSCKQSQIIDGIEVLPLESVMKRFKKSKVIVCTLSDFNQVTITKKLRDNGFENVYSVYPILFYYKVSVLGHNRDEVLDLLCNIKYSSENLIISALNVPITEKCTLRCAKCSSLTPYISEPKHFNVKTIVKGCRRFLGLVDGVKRVVISGGEPLLNPELIDICEELQKFSNILMIRVITNGTIVPNKMILEKFRDYGICLTISDYRENSSEKDRLIRKCEEYGVSWDRNSYNYNTWIDFGDFTKCRNREYEKNVEIFKKCRDWVKAAYLINGEYYLCHRSAYIAHLNELRKDENEYVDVLENNLTDFELRRRIERLTNETKVLSACDFCNTRFNEKIIPGKQVVEILKYNKSKNEREKME